MDVKTVIVFGVFPKGVATAAHLRGPNIETVLEGRAVKLCRRREVSPTGVCWIGGSFFSMTVNHG